MPRPKKARAELVGATSPYLATRVAPVAVRTWPRVDALRQYRMDLASYQEMYAEQDGRCAICTTQREPSGLVIDHNHKTGVVRGLLCVPCNTGLGLLKDSPDLLDAAIDYLEERGCYGPNALG